jgi:ArsR family transcriptional regulator
VIEQRTAPVTTSDCESPLARAEPGSATISLARGFSALGDPVRLHMFGLIAGAGEMCVCDLVEPSGRTQATVSHHIRVLLDAGLLIREKRGAWSWYQVVPGRLATLAAVLTDPSAATDASGDIVVRTALAEV